MEINIKTILVVIIVCLFIYLLYPHVERFDARTVEFVPVNAPKYGLRGDKLRTYDIARNYIGTHRQLALDPSSGQMWESDNSPISEGINGCTKTACPNNLTDYDNLDTCYQCGSADRTKSRIPDMEPHMHLG